MSRKEELLEELKKIEEEEENERYINKMIYSGNKEVKPND